MRVVTGNDFVLDIGPGAGDEGGQVVTSGAPAEVARSRQGRTAPYLARFIAAASRESNAHTACDDPCAFR